MPAARRLLVALFVLTSPLASVASPLLDADYTGYPVGPAPRLLVAGDLTGDGFDDLVVDDADGIGCLVARGDGTFAPLVRVSATQASAIAIANLTGDAHADLAIAGQETPEVRIFAGRGDGTFGSQVVLRAPSRSPGLLARDLDGDGTTDLVASDMASRALWFSFGLPGGQMSMPTYLHLNVVPGRILAGDLGGDGTPDLFVLHANAQAGFTLLRNNGLGLFDDPVLYDGPGGSSLGATGDFNGDLVPDIAIPEPDQYQSNLDIAVWYGRKDGTFAAPALVHLGGRVTGTASTDLDGDGIDELIVAGDRYQQVLKGSTTGLLAPGPVYRVDQMTAPIVTGRFDADRNRDVAAVELGQNGGGISESCLIYVPSTIFVWRGNGDGSLRGAPVLAANGRLLKTITADVDRDGHADLVAGSSASIAFLRGHGDGTFDPAVVRALSGSVRDFTLVDVDEDGVFELAFIAGGALLVESVDAQFGLTLRAMRPVGDYAFKLAARDFDGDGRVDFAVTNTVTPRAVRTFLAGAEFSWTGFRETVLPHSPTMITSADLDRDGHPDLLVGGNIGSLLYYRGIGDGTFSLIDSVDTGALPLAAAVLDRGRGDPIVVAGGADPDCISGKPGVLVFRSIEGVFAREQGPLFVGGRPLTLDFADVTGDGLPDMVASANLGRVTVRPGLPDGSYGDRLEFGVSAGVGPAAVADFDEDGRPDVAVSTPIGIALLLNRGGAVYMAPSVAARIGGGPPETVLTFGDPHALPFVIAGTAGVDVHAIDPSTVRLSGAQAIDGRARVVDGVTPDSPAFDACAQLLDGNDGRDDLEVVFRSDEVLDGWLRANPPEFPRRTDARVVSLPFLARRLDGTSVTGAVCALIVGDAHEAERFSLVSLRSFGVRPGFESGVGVMLTLPWPARRAVVAVYDLAGRRRATLHRGSLAAGVHRLTWSDEGVRPGPGIYFARAEVDGTLRTARILVAR